MGFVRGFISFFVRQHIAVNLAGAVIAAAGIAVFLLAPKEILPEIDFGAVQINTRFPGASPEEAEDLVTVHVEDAVKNLSGVEKVTSLSGEGFSLVSVELSPSLKNTADAINDIKDAVEKALPLLPAESANPEVKEISTKEFPVITVALSGSDYAGVRSAAKKADESFKSLKGVASVEKLGFRGRTIWVNVSKDKLQYYELPILSVVEALKNSNVSIPVGARDLGDSRVKIKLVSKTGASDDINRVIVRSAEIGHALKVSDLAKVQEGYEDLEYSIDVDGKPGIIMTVFKLSGNDSSAIARRVREDIVQLRAAGAIGRDVAVSFSNDTSVQVRERISLLVSNGAVGLLFILAILFITLDRKLGFWITIGLPVTYGMAFLIMKAAGVGFDMLSLFGLIVVLGILDDDAIVVGENVYRHRAMGKDPLTAAVDGTAEVALPVFVSFLTTAAAFMPLLLIGGIWGKFLAPIALAVIFSIMASLLECFLVMPSHLALSSHASAGKDKYDIFKPFYKPYEKYLNLFLKHRGKIILSGIVIMIIASALTLRGGIVFAENNIETIIVKYETSASSSLSNTAEYVRRARSIIAGLSLPGIESIYGLAGIEQESPGAAQKFSANSAMLQINLTSSQNRAQDSHLNIINSLQGPLAAMQGVEKLSIKEKAGGGPPNRGDIDITFTGDSHNSAKQAAMEAYESVSSLNGVTSLLFKKTECRPEYNIAFNRAAAAETGVSLQAMATTLRGAVSGLPVKTLRLNEETVELKVRLSPEDYVSPGELLFLRVPAAGGAFVRLNKLASFSSVCGSEALTRYNGKPSYSLTGNIDKTTTSVGAVNLKIIPLLNEIVTRHRGVTYRLGGDYGEIKDRFAELGLLFLLAVCLMYTILASFFNSLTKPLIVLAAVPVSFTGVMIALLISGLPISFPALIAVFALTGVSVNNALVMMDFMNGLVAGGKNREEAVIEAAMLRFKAIMISSFTVAFGILPLGYAVLGGQDAFLRPFALALGLGIIFSGPAVIFAVPIAYVVHENTIARLGAFFKRNEKPELLFNVHKKGMKGDNEG